MKKFVKIIAVIAVFAGLLLAKNYMLFDHRPFDDLKAGEIERAFLHFGNSEYIELTDLGAIPDTVKNLSAEKRTNNPDTSLKKGSVKLTLYMADGSEKRVSVDNTYLITDNGYFIADPVANREFLTWAYQLIIFGQEPVENAVQERIDEIVSLAVDGKNQDEIRDYAKEQSGIDKERLRTFANSGYSPVEIYIMTEENRDNLFNDILKTTWKFNYKELADDVWHSYKRNDIPESDAYQSVPQDYLFTENLDWEGIDFVQNEMGYYYVMIPSEDNRYNMCISIDDTEYVDMDGTVTDNPPFVRKVTFYKQ